MAWIEVIEEAAADAALREAYASVSASRGRVANILKIHSLVPKSMTVHVSLYKQLMFGKSPLSRREREMIGVVVSAANCCHY